MHDKIDQIKAANLHNTIKDIILFSVLYCEHYESLTVLVVQSCVTSGIEKTMFYIVST